MSKKLGLFSLCVLTGLLLTGCGSPRGKALTVGADIAAGDVTEFYYTYENINYNASYQRYRFYVGEGGNMFFHETRERHDDYGPTTEKDTTLTGDFELTDGEWSEFFELIKDGTVRKRDESFVDGDSGPWTFIYWKGDKSEYQEYSFPSPERRREFERFCAGLAHSER